MRSKRHKVDQGSSCFDVTVADFPEESQERF